MRTPGLNLPTGASARSFCEGFEIDASSGFKFSHKASQDFANTPRLQVASRVVAISSRKHKLPTRSAYARSAPTRRTHATGPPLPGRDGSLPRCMRDGIRPLEIT